MICQCALEVNRVRLAPVSNLYAKLRKLAAGCSHIFTIPVSMRVILILSSYFWHKSNKYISQNVGLFFFNRHTGTLLTLICYNRIQQDELTSRTNQSCPPDKLSDLQNMPKNFTTLGWLDRDLRMLYSASISSSTSFKQQQKTGKIV